MLKHVFNHPTLVKSIYIPNWPELIFLDIFDVFIIFLIFAGAFLSMAILMSLLSSPESLLIFAEFTSLTNI